MYIRHHIPFYIIIPSCCNFMILFGVSLGALRTGLQLKELIAQKLGISTEHLAWKDRILIQFNWKHMLLYVWYFFKFAMLLFFYMFLLFVLRGYVRCNHIIACCCGNMLLAPTQQIRCTTSTIICHFCCLFSTFTSCLQIRCLSWLWKMHLLPQATSHLQRSGHQGLDGEEIWESIRWPSETECTQSWDLIRARWFFAHVHALCTTHKMRCNCILG